MDMKDKKATLLILLFLVGIVVLAMVFQSSSSEDGGTMLKVYIRKVTKEKDGVVFEVYLKNEGSEEMTFYCGKPMMFVEVRDTRGNLVGVYPRTVLDVLIKVTLKPGETYREEVRMKLPKGTYRIRAFAELSFDSKYKNPIKIWSKSQTVLV